MTLITLQGDGFLVLEKVIPWWEESFSNNNNNKNWQQSARFTSQSSKEKIKNCNFSKVNALMKRRSRSIIKEKVV